MLSSTVARLIVFGRHSYLEFSKLTACAAITNKCYYSTYSSSSNAVMIMEWYRKLIKKASFIPNQAKRKQMLQQIKKEFKDTTEVSSSSNWIKKAEEALQFLTMITPKTPTSKQGTPSTSHSHNDGIVKYVKIDGEWVDVRYVDPEKLQKKDTAYMKGGSEDSFSQSPSSPCPPGGCGRCQF